MKQDDVIYSINVEDVQTVAMESFGKELTKDEIKIIIDTVGEKINWSEIIYYSIKEKLGLDDID